MGVRMEEVGGGGGGLNSNRRRSSVIDYIPRYGPASPFKGHLSTKSNAFCIDSSSHRLSSQYLIRDHMAVHYNKILSAKAAVDCSVPKSRINSIKFSDQQRREKLKKEIERCEKEMISSKNVSRSSSRESRRPLSATNRNDSWQTKGNVGLPTCAASEERYMLAASSTPEKQSIISPTVEKTTRNAAQKSSNISVSSSNTTASSLQRPRSKISCSSSSDSFAGKHPHKAQSIESKRSSRDLLDKHSEHFTSGQQPFTPRTLKSDAKSFLSQYRYYMPARRKMQDLPKQQVEAETQTDISSFQVELMGSEGKHTADIQKIVKEVEGTMSASANTSDELKAISQFFSPRVTSPSSAQSPTMRKFQAEEEELLYLNFIQDITDEILRLGLFSNRALERLFERHIKQNRNHLDETKMRHLLEILKVDLGCKKEEKSTGRLHKYALPVDEGAEHLSSEVQREDKLAESREFFRAMDLIANEPPALNHECQKAESPNQIIGDVSDPAHVEPNPSDLPETAGSLDTSCTLLPTCSSTTCDADFESNESLRGVDELQESFAELFPITTDNAP
ncbi:hypothetical protein JRQ81_001037 [Phrynocephalus forsythii]|uniref:Spermatogenesis associated 7 n=1 Tax=Phrynocephalus forsythii TaxID=171643 RepID=A0A9Q0Y7J3_9SAUR|nr:hypothetical protein JRQ81_001037 [Phrynocephalus forsythii]